MLTLHYPKELATIVGYGHLPTSKKYAWRYVGYKRRRETPCEASKPMPNHLENIFDACEDNDVKWLRELLHESVDDIGLLYSIRRL